MLTGNPVCCGAEILDLKPVQLPGWLQMFLFNSTGQRFIFTSKPFIKPLNR